MVEKTFIHTILENPKRQDLFPHKDIPKKSCVVEIFFNNQNIHSAINQKEKHRGSMICLVQRNGCYFLFIIQNGKK